METGALGLVAAWILATPLPLAASPQAPPPTTRLEGLVGDAKSTPVGNVRITVLAGDRVVAATRSDGSGAFVLGRLPAERLVVRATSDGTDVDATEVDLQVQPVGFVRLRLQPARSVRGTVEDAAGRPLAGAFVATAPLGAVENGWLGQHTLSGNDGSFAFEHVPFGPNALRVWAPDCAGLAQTIDGAGDLVVHCRMPDDDVQQRAFELLDASPDQLAQASVVVAVFAQGVEVPLPPAVRQPRRGEDGRWLAAGWPHDDAMHARAELPNAFVEPPVLCIDAGLPDRTKRFYVIAGDEGWMRGSLATDAGPAGADVPLLVEEPRSGRRSVGRTAADGTFALRSPVPAGSLVRLRCLDPRYALRHSLDRGFEPVPQPRAEVSCKHLPSKPLALFLVPATTVRGTVLDADGRPCAGAEVVLLSEQRQEVTRGVPGLRPVVLRVATVLARGHSRVDGTVELPGLYLRDGEGVVVQVAGPDGFGETTMVADEQRELRFGTLRTGPAATLRGRVLDSAGQPVAGERLLVENWNGADRTHAVVTGRDGAFVLRGLMPGHGLVRRQGPQKSLVLVALVAGETAEVDLPPK